MKNILITGATGFIGRRVIPLLRDKHVLALIWKKNNQLETSGRKILNNYGIRTKKIDLLDKQSMGLITGYQTIFHLAANTNTADPDHRVNDQGTINLFNSIGDMSPRHHFVFVSSAAMLPAPTNEYGRAKYRAEKFLLQKQKEMGFKLTIIRPTTVYGEKPRNDSMFDFINKCLKRNFWPIDINWPGKVGLVYVNDVAKFIVQSLFEKKRLAIYNLATENLRFCDIVSVVKRHLIIKTPQIKFPSVLWKITSYSKIIVYLVEKVLPTTFYNLLWRTTLIVDSITCHPRLPNLKCSQTLVRFFPNRMSLHKQ